MGVFEPNDIIREIYPQELDGEDHGTQVRVTQVIGYESGKPIYPNKDSVVRPGSVELAKLRELIQDPNWKGLWPVTVAITVLR